jgi:hypothetical protein
MVESKNQREQAEWKDFQLPGWSCQKTSFLNNHIQEKDALMIRSVSPKRKHIPTIIRSEAKNNSLFLVQILKLCSDYKGGKHQKRRVVEKFKKLVEDAAFKMNSVVSVVRWSDSILCFIKRNSVELACEFNIEYIPPFQMSVYVPPKNSIVHSSVTSKNPIVHSVVDHNSTKIKELFIKILLNKYEKNKIDESTLADIISDIDIDHKEMMNIMLNE